MAYATKHVNVLKLFPRTESIIQQQAFVYAAANGSLAALEFILIDDQYSMIDINGLDPVHGETGTFEARKR